MDTEYINIFQSKALQNCPKLGFWFEKKHLATLVKKLSTWICQEQYHTSEEVRLGAGWPDAVVEEIAQHVAQAMFCQN
jgi:hypothetical protein